MTEERRFNGGPTLDEFLGYPDEVRGMFNYASALSSKGWQWNLPELEELGQRATMIIYENIETILDNRVTK